MKIFTSVILLISSAALLTSIHSLRMLKKMDLLNRDYWKQNAVKNGFAYLLWIALWLGSIGLLLKLSWAKRMLEFGLVMFLVMVLMIGITQIIGALKVLDLWGNENVESESGGEVEEDLQQYEYEAAFEGGNNNPMKKYVFQKVIVSVILMIFISAFAIWALVFLQ